MHVQLTDHIQDLARLAEAIVEFCQAEQLADLVQNRLHLILEELFVNAATHGAAVPGASAIQVCLHRRGAEICIDFIDCGRPYNPFLQPSPRIDASVEERRIGGLGVELIRQLASETVYERTDGRNQIRVTLAAT